jgi:hypothetical protein
MAEALFSTAPIPDPGAVNFSLPDGGGVPEAGFLGGGALTLFAMFSRKKLGAKQNRRRGNRQSWQQSERLANP